MLLSQKSNNAPISVINNAQSLTTKEELFNYFNDFINFCDTSKATIKTYSKALKVFFNYLDVNNIAHPQREDLINYRNYLLDKGLQATTIASYINALKQFFKWTYDKGLYRNIADHIKGAKVNTQIHRKEALTLEQAREVLLKASEGETLEAKRNFAILYLAFACGLRTIEIVRANICDITFKSGSVALLIQGKGRVDKADFVKLPYSVEKTIREYLHLRGENNEQAPLFTSLSDRNNGGRLTTTTISRIIKKAFRDVGLNNALFTAHSTRHTFITLFLLNGGTLEEARQIARHTSINTTMIYNHALDRAKNNGEETIANLLDINKRGL